MPLYDRPIVVAVVVVYMAAVLAIGAWAATRTRSARDFFVAGQRLGLVVTAMAAMSAAFSGFVFIGGPGLTYRMGIASLWIVLPISFTGGLLCWVVARKLRALAEIREIFTVPDAISVRFENRAAHALAAVAVAVGSIAYLAAQFLALGILLQSVFGVRDLAAAIAIGVLVLVVYSVAGGMIAAAYTDLLQGGLMIGAAVAVFVQALRVTGGWSELTGSIAASDRFGASFLEPFGGAPALTAFSFLFVFGVGVLGQPHMLHKFYMLRDPATLRWLPAILGGGQAACVLVWVGIGLAVPALVAGGRLAPRERPDDASALFLIGYVPDALAGLILAAVLAAIMSTADSFLNIGAAALVRDLPRALGRPVVRELARGRVAVVAIAIVSAALAHGYGDLVALLGTLAFGTFAAALAPALAIGLNWSRVSGRAAAASIATGLVVNLGLELAQRFPAVPWPFAAGVQPSAVALASSFLVLLAWTLRSRAPCSVIAEDIREVLDEVV